ncbi:MAG: hypothetical protein ACC707_09145 [Thiohalomonadales bacterium]
MKFLSVLGLMFIACLLAVVASSGSAFALGNHPEANTCPNDKPYYVFCSHSLHNLEGWIGGCHKTRQSAQVEADEHAMQRHNGNSRWTGVLKIRP